MKNLWRILLLAWMVTPASAAIEISQAVLYEGQPVTVTTDEPVDTVTITYRPNSQVSSIAYLTASGPATSFQWIPAKAGVVAITAGSSSTNVSVRFPGISWSGIGIMILAGCLLFGGSAFAFRLLMSDNPVEEVKLEVERRPDT